jgi:hypothetical protein
MSSYLSAMLLDLTASSEELQEHYSQNKLLIHKGEEGVKIAIWENRGQIPSPDWGK